MKKDNKKIIKEKTKQINKKRLVIGIIYVILIFVFIFLFAFYMKDSVHNNIARETITRRLITSYVLEFLLFFTSIKFIMFLDK